MILTLSSCAVRTPPPTIITEPEIKSDILNNIRLESQKLHSIKASGTMTVTYEGLYHKLKFASVFQQPDQLRLDVYILFGKLAASMVVEADTLLSYSPMTNEYFKAALADLKETNGVRLPINMQDFLPLLTASVEFPENDVSLARQGKWLLAEWTQNDQHVQATYHADKLYLKQLTRRDSLNNEVDMFFEQHRKVDDIYRPGQATVTQSKRSEKLSLIYRKQTLNATISEKVFQLNVPEGAVKARF